MAKRTNIVNVHDPIAGYQTRVDLAALPEPQLQALKSAMTQEEHERTKENQQRRAAQSAFEPEPNFDSEDARPNEGSLIP